MGRKLLIPLDGSPESESIIPEALRLRSPADEIHLLHVAPLPTPSTGEPTKLLGLQEMALPYLEGVRQRLDLGGGLEVVRSGPAAEAILQVALEMNIDLVAMTTHARKGLRRWFMGSVAEEVVRRTELPVLLKRPDLPVRAKPIERILVPLESPDRCPSILETVKPIARRARAEVILLHVISPVLDPAPQWALKGPIALGGGPESEYQQVADLLEKEEFDAWPLVTDGDPAKEILAQARALDVDLVAMSTHGRTGFARTLFGSVTQAVMSEIDRPVLLIRPS